MNLKIRMFFSMIILSGILAGCSYLTDFSKTEEIEIVPTATPLPYQQLGVLEVEGSVYDSPDSYYGKYNRPFVLYDLTGYMRNNENWLMKPENMVIAHINTQNGKNTFTLNLPINPNSMFHDVNDNGTEEDGVQIFTYWWAKDLWLSDYIEEDEQYLSWPVNDLAIRFDESGTKIVSGWMLIWAEDNQQMFPVNVGEDGVLFTKDDVMQPILPGYTSVYLEDGVLTWNRSEKVKVSILAPYDIRQFDLSRKTALEAYDQTIKLLEENYQDWDEEVSLDERDYIKFELREELKTAIEENNTDNVNATFGKLISVMENGMVSLSSNSDLDMIKAAYPADFGFTAETFSDGVVRVTDMRVDSPTFSTNLDIGYIILEVDNKPVDEALADTPISFFPNSDEETTRRLQEIFLFRKPEDEKIKIKVLDLKGEEETLTLTSTAGTEFLESTIPQIFGEYSINSAPVIAETIENFGVIHINDMGRDPALTHEMFEKALYSFWNEGIKDFVIDLRYASGDTYLHLAGYFNSAIEKKELGTYSCAGEHPWVINLKGKSRKFDHDSISVLIDSGCRGACELEALAFSKLDGTILYGNHPTNGTFDIDFQTTIKLPNGLRLEFPYCSMEKVNLPVQQESYDVIPDVILDKPFYEAVSESSYMVRQVIYRALENEYKKYSKEPLESLTINELIQYYKDAVYINSTVYEDEQAILYFHDQPSYDLYVPVYLETDSKGTFDYTVCMDSYSELLPVIGVVSPTFYLDSEEVPSSNIYESSYFSEAKQNCHYWLFGTRTFPPGVHEITMKLTIEEPVTFHDSLWEPGEYEYHYHFIFTPKKEK